MRLFGLIVIDQRPPAGGGASESLRLAKSSARSAAAAAIFSLIGIIVSAGFSVYGTFATNKVALQGQLREQMMRYLSERSRVLASLPGQTPLTLPGYLALDSEGRIAIDIVAGLQLGVADLMLDAGDHRADLWLNYSVGIEGPIACGNMNAYARRPELRQKISEKRSELRGSAMCDPDWARLSVISQKPITLD